MRPHTHTYTHARTYVRTHADPPDTYAWDTSGRPRLLFQGSVVGTVDSREAEGFWTSTKSPSLDLGPTDRVRSDGTRNYS